MKQILKAILIAILAALLIDAGIWIWKTATAEEANGQAWVLCSPDSFVTVRSGPGKNRRETGGLDCGAHLWTDSTERNGYLHIVDMNAEDPAGWISLKYVVFDQPVEVNRRMVVRAQGRVAIRKSVDGKVTGWLRSGDAVTVYWMSDSWAVTSRGYVMSRYLTEDDDGRRDLQ